MDDLDILDSFLKTPGGVEKQKKKCGKPNCKCAKGKRLHGPYYCYRFWKFENGKYIRKRRYIDKKLYVRIQKAILRYKKREPLAVYGMHGERVGYLEPCLYGMEPNYEVIDELSIPMSRYIR